LTPLSIVDARAERLEDSSTSIGVSLSSSVGDVSNVRRSSRLEEHPSTEDFPMRRALVSLLAFSLAAVVVSCSGGSLTDSQSVARELNGTWSELFTIPGSSLVITLATHDTTVSGTGTYSNEAGPSGTMACTGTISGNAIDLDVVFDDRHVMHFTGELSSPTRLLGIWHSTPMGDPVNIEFDKVS
jgi:hypothetical protein